MGSPFTARLCRLIADRLVPGTPVAERVLGWRGNPGGRADALPLGRARRDFWADYYFREGPRLLADAGEAGIGQ